VLCHDPRVTVDPDLVELDEVLARADLLVIGTPHPMYADVETETPVVDIWNLRADGVMV
jgi:UDP-N-acetyl-D-mannosaminuronic acid dehydrogenase